MLDRLAEIQQAIREQEAINNRLIAEGKTLCKKCKIVIFPDAVDGMCTVCRLKRQSKNRSYQRRNGCY